MLFSIPVNSSAFQFMRCIRAYYGLLTEDSCKVTIFFITNEFVAGMIVCFISIVRNSRLVPNYMGV